jgi:hypothetical protein
MAVMSMLTVVASYAFSLFSRDWTVVSKGYERAAGQFRRFELMQRAILDSLPWVVEREDGSEGLYFLGRADGLTLVTGSPIFSTNSLAVIRLIVEKTADGHSRLVYEEAPLKELILLRADQALPFTFRITIMESATDIVFQYRWLQTAIADDTGGGGSSDSVLVWAAEFDGLELLGQPVDMSLEIGGTTTYFALPQRADTALGRVRGSL